MSSRKLTLSGPDAAELIALGSTKSGRDSILYWTRDYWEKKVEGSPVGTMRAKRADLQLFLSFFDQVVRSDELDYWTPSLSKTFRSWLQKNSPEEPQRRHTRAYAPTSINRMLATLRHFARHIARERPFESGDPLHEVADLLVAAPEWNGLSDLELMRLRAALDQVSRLARRDHQMPRRNRAVFVVALDTGLRASELSQLDFGQYDSRYFRNVRCKAGIYRDVYVSSDARKDLDDYIQHERGTDVGPLFLTNRNGRMSRQQIDRFLRQVAAHANAKLPADQHIHLHAHMLRHTSTKKVYDSRGAVEAKHHGGHRSFKQLERYATQTREEREEMRDGLWS